MRDNINRFRVGIVIVLGVFILFLAGIFGLFFELPRFYKSEMSLDFQKVREVDSNIDEISNLQYDVVSPSSTAKIQRMRDMISVASRKLFITRISKMEQNPGNGVKMFRKMIYGHNSANTFGGLFSLGIGSNFTVTLDGEKTTYRVSEIVTFEKSSSTSLSVNGKKYTMDALTKNAKGHDLMLLTCAGKSLGNGDATHRLAVFGDRV